MALERGVLKAQLFCHGVPLPEFIFHIPYYLVAKKEHLVTYTFAKNDNSRQVSIMFELPGSNTRSAINPRPVFHESDAKQVQCGLDGQVVKRHINSTRRGR